MREKTEHNLFKFIGKYQRPRLSNNAQKITYHGRRKYSNR